MPINDTQFRIARALNKKQQARLWSIADRPGAGFEDPDYIKTSKAFNDTSRMIGEYEQANRKVDEGGKLTSEPPTHMPATVGAAEAKVADSPLAPSDGRPPPGYNYFFEPSIPEVQSLLRKDPSVAMKAGLDPAWMTGIATPEHPEDVTDQTSGMKMGTNVVPATTHLDELTTDRSAYKDVANYLYAQKADEARKKGVSLQRYRDVPLKGHIPDFLAGGAIYNIERRLTPGVLGAADAMTMGLASPAGDYLTEKIGDAAEGMGMDIGEQPTAEDVKNRSPFSYLLGNLYGYGLPGNPTNLLQEGIASEGLKKASKYITPGVGTKAGVAAVAGGGANAIEGAVGEFGRELGDGKSAGEATRAAVSSTPLNWLFGAGAGALGDVVAQGAGKARQAIREQEHLKAPLKTLREGGGDTHMLLGVTPSDDIERHMRASDNDGTVGSPAALAAEEVAPQIQESLERQDVEAGDLIGRQMEEYYAHPKYNNVRISTKPLVKAMVDMIHEGRFSAPVSGAPAHMDYEAVRTIQNELVRNKWAEPVYDTPEVAKQIAADVDGLVVDLDTATDIFGSVPDHVGAGEVAVIVPKHMTAKELTRFEEKVYGKLKPREDGSRVESPVYQKLDKAAKEVRDKFRYYVDDQDRLVDPPEGSRSSSSEPPESLRPDEYSEILDSSEAKTLQRPPEAETELNSDDFINDTERLNSDDFLPSAEELGSDDFLTRSGVELGSADFDPATAAPEAGKPTPRLRDIRRRYPEGPQKEQYENHNDYLMERARWRQQQGKATAGDKARIRKAADAMPSTERMPETEAPNTQRSIAPPDDETPLSMLAGNKLAMPDNPEAPKAPEITDDMADVTVLPDPRSGEAKRAGDLADQQKAFDEAQTQIADVEKRFGQFDEDSRLKSILSMLSQKLGRDVTKEDLVRAGLITGGVAASLSDDENVQGAGAMAVMGGGGGFKKGAPRELERKLPNGETVRGFSALRGKQHDLKSGIETAKRRVGATNEKTVKDRVMNFNLGDDIDFDKALLEEAKKLGLEKELKTAAATRVYPKLKRQAWGGSNKGSLEGAASFFGLRGDKLFELLSGTPRNPFKNDSPAMFWDDLREQLNLSGGRVGARHGDDLRKHFLDEKDDNNGR